MPILLKYMYPFLKIDTRDAVYICIQNKSFFSGGGGGHAYNLLLLCHLLTALCPLDLVLANVYFRDHL